MKDRKATTTNRRYLVACAVVASLMLLGFLLIRNAHSQSSEVDTSEPSLKGREADVIPSNEEEVTTNLSPLHKGGLLQAAPMTGRPTPDTITLTLKASAFPVSVRVKMCKEASSKTGCETDPWNLEFITWRPSKVVQYGLAVQLRAEDKATEGSGRVLNLRKKEFVEMTILGLEPGTSYNWFVVVKELPPFTFAEGKRKEGYSGRFTTQRTAHGSSFSFNVFADPHLFSEQFSEQFSSHPEKEQMLQVFYEKKKKVEEEFLQVAELMNADKPDFVVALGDPFDLHGLGFTPALSKEEAILAHAYARQFFAKLNDTGAMYQVVGNWEGESGCHPTESKQNAVAARQLFQINPRPSTYHWVGSADEDYYAFSWGDMLAVVLNVLGYDETCHQQGQVFGSKKYGNYKSFTLGETQKKFVEKTLTESKHAYKLVFIHHGLAGRSRDPINADYGRGGYLAAKIGAQRWLHELMVEAGVQIMFYGHDHVFTDGVVDNVHYTLPGTISAPWRFGGQETGYTKFNTTNGYARVNVSPAEMAVEFVSGDSKVFYSYKIKSPKHQSSGLTHATV